MSSFPRKVDQRRSVYLSLSSQIEGQLREAYARRFATGVVTQSSIAEKLNINRSAVHHRLMGHTNMTIETIADMVWALGYAITVKIYDPLSISGEASASSEARREVVEHGNQNRIIGISRATELAGQNSSSLDVFLKRANVQLHQQSSTHKISALEAATL